VNSIDHSFSTESPTSSFARPAPCRILRFPNQVNVNIVAADSMQSVLTEKALIKRLLSPGSNGSRSSFAV